MRSTLPLTLAASFTFAVPTVAQEPRPAAAAGPLKTVWEGKKSGW